MDNAKKLLETHGLALLLLAAALAVRLYRFGDVPPGFNQDEAMAAYEALSLSLYGTDRFGMSYPVYFTAWGYAQMNVLLSYTMIPFIRLFGLSAVMARLPVLIIGMAGLYSLYRFSFAVYGKGVALTVLTFAAVSPWHIMHTRWALESNLFPHLLMMGVWFLYSGLKKPYKLYLAMVIFGLSMYAYGIAYLTVPLFLLITGIYLLINKTITLQKTLFCVLVYLLVAWPIFALMVINYFEFESLKIGIFTIPFFPDSTRMGGILFFSDGFFRQLSDNFIDFFRVVFLQNDGAPWNMIPGYGALYKWAMPFCLAGIVYMCIKKSKANPGQFIVLCWLGVSFFAGIIINHVNLTRINMVYYPLLIAGGLAMALAVKLPLKLATVEIHAKINHGIFSITYEKKDKKARLWSRIAAVCIAAVMVFSFIGFSQAYFRRYSDELEYVFFKGFYDSLDYVNERDWDRLYVTAWTQFPGFWHVSEIMTLYGLRINPAVYQNTALYRDTFRYVSFDSVPVPEPRALYVFNTREREYFPPGQFETFIFGGFGVAKPLP
jgi:lipoprotein signal peptidase